MKEIRRIVCADGPDGKSKAVHDGPAPVMSGPGFSSTFIWATDATPARIDGDPPRVLAPPPGGSLCRILTFPPERAPHRRMQKTRTLDFCLVLEGEITLVLDAEEVKLTAGDTVVQRGTSHAWSNRSDAPCVLAISSHDATY